MATSIHLRFIFEFLYTSAVRLCYQFGAECESKGDQAKWGNYVLLQKEILKRPFQSWSREFTNMIGCPSPLPLSSTLAWLAALSFPTLVVLLPGRLDGLQCTSRRIEKFRVRHMVVVFYGWDGGRGTVVVSLWWNCAGGNSESLALMLCVSPSGKVVVCFSCWILCGFQRYPSNHAWWWRQADGGVAVGRLNCCLHFSLIL